MPRARDHRPAARLIGMLVALTTLPALAACDRMAVQPKDKPYAARDKASEPSARGPVAGTVAREVPDETVPAITLALLQRGREQFDIYCAPCHGRVGDGKGMIVERGFPEPPSFHADRLRAASDAHFVTVMTQGYGAMFSYADRVAPRDRWAIAAYIRALQASQHTQASALDPDEREKLP